MANLDFDMIPPPSGPDPEEDPVDFMQRRARVNLVSAMEEDPEETARAVQLSKASGVPASIIGVDQENFENTHRAALSSEIVKNNKFLQAYLQDETAAKLSHDDIGPLDQASESIGKLNQPTELKTWLDFVRPSRLAEQFDPADFMKGYGDVPLGWAGVSDPKRPQDLEWALSHPLAASTVAAIATPMEFVSRVTNGLMEMGHEGVAKIAGTQFANDLFGEVERRMTGAELGEHIAKEGITERVGEKLAAGRPVTEEAAAGTEPKPPMPPAEFIEKHAEDLRNLMHGQQVSEIFHEAGEEPPPHIDPLIDKSKADQIREDLQRLKDAVRDSAATATRERSADHFARFAALPGEGEIGIDSAEIRRIYGDKVPEEGDGLLGWIPGLGDRLARAETYGGDIWVDRAQFLAKTEREVVNEIGDGLRLRDGGVTVGETKVEVDPKQVIADDLPAIRGGAGMEPRAHVGDRKVTLRLGEAEAGEPRSVEILSDTGESMGTLKLSEREGALNIDELQINPEHQAFLDPQFLGHSLVEDVKRQLQGAFPKAETITHAEGPQVKLQLGDDPQNLRDMLSALWRPIYESKAGIVEALHWTPGKGLAMNSPMGRLVLGEIQRLAPGAKGQVVHGLVFTDRPEMVIRGAYLPGIKQIVTSLEGKDPLGTTRHEVIHFLRQTGLFSEAEWSKLAATSREQGWHERFDIGRRYGKLSEDVQMEESIAEAYRHWADGRLKVSDAEIFERIKQFLQNMLEKVQEQLGLKDATWDEIFEKVESGEIGKRGVEAEAEGREPLAAAYTRKEIIEARRAARQKPEKPGRALEREEIGSSEERMIRENLNYDGVGSNAWHTENYKLVEGGLGGYKLVDKRTGTYESVPEHTAKALLEQWKENASHGGEPLAMAEHPEDREDFPIEKGKTVGVAESRLRREEALLKELQERDWKADQKRQQKQIRDQLLPEAKERGKEINKQVREEFAGRPELAVDKFMSEGQVKFDPDHLSAEQKERLPKDYVAKGGMNPDDLAGTLGYTSGDAMVERLAMLTEDRKRSGLDQKAYYNKQVKAEYEKRLNAEFGPKRDEILQEYRDHALSETQMQLTHVETIRKAVELGITPKLTLENMKAMAKSVLDETPIGEIKSTRYLQKAGAIAMKVAEAEQKGQHPEAYRLLQQKQLAQLVAKEAVEYEKRRKQWDRMAKSYTKNPTEETAKKIDISYYNWFQHTLARLGYNIDVAELNRRVQLQDHKTLQNFVASKQVLFGRVEPPDILLDPTGLEGKTLKDLTFGQFGDIHDFVKMLDHEGRDEKFLERYGEQAAVDEVAADIKAQLKDNASLYAKTTGSDKPRTASRVMKGAWWGHIKVEAMWDRLDLGNPSGLFNTYLSFPVAKAINGEYLMAKEYRAKFNAIKKGFKNLNKDVENDVFFNEAANAFEPMKRRNVLKVLAEEGNPSNKQKRNTGWKVKDPTKVDKMLLRYTTVEDWDGMQAMGDIFEELINKAEAMVMKVTGAPIKRVKIEPFTDPFGVRRRGWYSPVDYESMLSDIRDRMMAQDTSVERPGYYRADTNQSYSKERTGFSAPTSLTLDIIPQRMGQIIHDINVRPALIQARKILYHKDVSQAIKTHYGEAQLNEMKSFLNDMANRRNADSDVEGAMNAVVGFMRKNTITNLVGGNIGTLLKHFPTALLHSATQIGTINFWKQTVKLFRTDPLTQERYFRTYYNESNEMKGRLHNIADTIRGEGEKFQFEQGTFQWIRELNSKILSYPVAAGDFVSVMQVYGGARDAALEKGLSLPEAIDIGDRAIRESHGSARLHGQPAVMRTTNELARSYSSLYGFFSNVLQKAYKISWQSRDLLNGQKPMDIEGRPTPYMIGKFVNYLIIPALIEGLVTPYEGEEKDNWYMKAGKMLALGLSPTLPFVKDFVQSLIEPEREGGGLFSSTSKAFADIGRDLGNKPFNKQHAGQTIKDVTALVSILAGIASAPAGKALQYAQRYATGQERPKGPWDVVTGLRYGKTDKHAHTFAEWWNHTVAGKGAISIRTSGQY